MEMQLLCRWLNEELRLSRIVEPRTFAKDFSSGYLIGEVLHKYNLQSDFSLFMKKDTAVSKLNNFTRLEPTLRLLRISFDTSTAQDLMDEKPGVASHLLYQLYMSLEKNKKAEISTSMMEIMQPAASVGHFKKEHGIFSEKLHQGVKRDADLKLQKISQRYEEKGKAVQDLRDPMGSYQQSINRPVENQSILQRRSLKVQEDTKKSTDINIQMPKPPAKNAPQLQQKKNQQLLQLKERQAEMVKNEIAQFETNRKKQVTSSFTSLPSSSGQPFPPDYHPDGCRKGVEVSGGEKKVTLQSNTKYIQEIRQRLEENAVASDQRDKRLNRFLMEQLKARDAQEEARREEQLIARLTRQTRQEQRLAAQLLQLRKQKDVIRENRLLREQQYQQRREKDFQEALDREAALAQQVRLEREDDIRMQLELCKRTAAERAQSRHIKHYNICADILEQILDLTTKIGEYRLVNQNLIPEKQMREWKELLFNGLPLYEPVKGHQPGLLTSLDPVEKEKQEILNNQDYDDYTNLTGHWAWPEEAGEAKSPPLNNDILGHVIQRLRTIQHQISLEHYSPPFPPLPPFTIKACVLSKYCAGKTVFLTTITEGLDIYILSADTLVNEALNAYKEEQLSQILPSSVVTEQQDGSDNQQLLRPLDSVPDTPDDAVVEPDGTESAPSSSATSGPEDKPAALPEKDGTASSSLSSLKGENVQSDPSISKATVPDTPDDAVVEPDGAESAPSSSVTSGPEDQPAALPEKDGTASNSLSSLEGENVQSDPSISKAPDVESQKEMECNTNLSSRAMKGARAEKELSEGNTISNELLVEIITEAIRELPANSGWILDGFPLDIIQAHLLEKALCESVEEEKKVPIQRTNLAVDPSPPEPPPPFAPALDLALLLDFSDEQMVSHALSLMDEDNDVATASQQIDKFVYNAQVPHGIVAFQEAWPELEEWFGHKQNILVRVEVEVVDEEFYSKVKSVLQQVMEKKQKVPDTPDEAVVEPDGTESAPSSSATSGPEDQPAALPQKDGTASSSLSSLEGKNVQSDPIISKATGPSGNISTCSLNEKDLHVGANVKSESTASIPTSSTQGSADQPIYPEIIKYLCPYWDMVCQSYVNNVKTVMERLRYQRTVFDQHNYIISERFKHFFGRQDSRQELVSQMQKDFNNVPDDMRDDVDNKTELHLRLDELREGLWDISDKRKEEDEQERATIMSDGWLEEQVSVVINLHSLLMQVELYRFQETLQILNIYYCSMCPNIHPKPSKMFYIPLTSATNNQEVKDLNEGEEKCPHPDSSVCSQTDVDKKIELIPLRSAVPSEEASLTPQEELINDYKETITAIENLVAAETQQGKKSTSVGEQTDVQSSISSISDIIQQEHAAALLHEASAAKVRIALVKGHGLVMLQFLQSGVDECFAALEKMLQEGYLTGMKSIDTLSEVVRHHIEAGIKLQNELVLGSCDFYLNGDHRLVESPPPPLRPPPSEKLTGSTLTVVQLESLNQQLRRVAPSGLIYSDEFLCFLKDYVLIRRGRHPMIEQWSEINERQLRDIVSLLTDDHQLVDWRRFLLSGALPWPPSSLSQLLEVLEKFKALDTTDSSYITEEQYAQTELWFSGDCNLVVPEDPSELLPYDRLSNLRRFFFQLFADHEATPPKLDYMHMLLYFAADSNPRAGFIRALSLVLGQRLKDSSSSSSSSSPPSHLVKSMPSIQESAELTHSDHDGENKEVTQGEVDPEVSISDFLAAFCHKDDKMKDSEDQNQEKHAKQLRQIFRELESDPDGRVPFSVLSQHPVAQALMESYKQSQLISMPSIQESAELTHSDHDGENKEDTQDEVDAEVSISDFLAAFCHKDDKMKDSEDQNQEKHAEQLRQIFRELESDPDGRVPFSVLSQHPVAQALMESYKQSQLINIHRVLQTNQGEDETNSFPCNESIKKPDKNI